MELQVFNKEQPGCSYYFSPLGIYILGMVDQEYVAKDGEICDHMHGHVNHEGVRRKGANYVCSLIICTLFKMRILQENDIGGKLNLYLTTAVVKTRTIQY